MQALIEKLEQRVRAARKANDIPALLTTGNAAIQQLEEAAAAGVSPEQIEFLNSAKKIAYNAAADAWPGWEVGMPAQSDATLQSAQAMAEKCKALSDRLALPATQRGNAIWLIGAFDLARGSYIEAVGKFQSAALAFEGEPELTLMAQGYSAIAGELSGDDSAIPEFITVFETVVEKLTAIATEEAKEFRDQLLVARKIFIGS